MPAFVLPLLTQRGTVLHNGKTSLSAPRTLPVTAKRRRKNPICSLSPAEDPSVATPDMLFDELVSDDEYVVVDGKDVAKLVEELQRTGMDDLDSTEEEEGLSEDFLTLAEKRTDEWSRRAAPDAEGEQTEEWGGDTALVAEKEQIDESGLLDVSNAEMSGKKQEAVMPDYSNDMDTGMKYFQDDHVEFMPNWAAEAFRSGTHNELEDGASRIGPVGGGKRLHDIVSREEADEVASAEVGYDGIVDCTVSDVADDYSVPVEFVVDAMLHYGVPSPVRDTQSIRDSMTTEEIGKLLKLITSFDAQDLSERYSDRTIVELADDYDLPVEMFLEVCQKEGLYLCLEERTRLSVVREDRVLDIILKGAARGQSYPSLLDGLE